MRFSLGIGTRTEEVEVPDRNLLGCLLPNEIPAGDRGAVCVEKALRHPVGTPRLSRIVKPGEKIVIITSDVTRPMPTYKVMPALGRELEEAGVRDEDVTIIIAVGSHRKQTEAEHRRLVGEEAYARYKVIDADASDCVHLGVTSRGTPVDVFRTAAEADRRILLGNIEYHYFAGYSGGAKAIMPGISTRDAIQANHSRMVRPEACAGRIEGNPVREDIEEAASFVGADFIVNVVLNEHKEIVFAVCGDMIRAHREGCAFLDRLYKKVIRQKAEIVLVSQGGAPKDLNLYQTQKALDNAKHAVKDGGTIILAGSCAEGLGERVFEEWMTEAPDAHSMVERIGKDFQLGGHKAAAIAMVLEKAKIVLVSDLPDETVKKIFLTPARTVQEALESALAEYGPHAGVLVMPYGGSTLPVTGERCKAFGDLIQ